MLLIENLPLLLLFGLFYVYAIVQIIRWAEYIFYVSFRPKLGCRCCRLLFQRLNKHRLCPDCAWAYEQCDIDEAKANGK